MNIKYDVLEPLSCNDLLNDFIKSDHVTMQIDYDTREECEKAYEAFRKARTRYKYEVTFQKVAYLDKEHNHYVDKYKNSLHKVEQESGLKNLILEIIKIISNYYQKLKNKILKEKKLKLLKMII